MKQKPDKQKRFTAESLRRIAGEAMARSRAFRYSAKVKRRSGNRELATRYDTRADALRDMSLLNNAEAKRLRAMR